MPSQEPAGSPFEEGQVVTVFRSRQRDGAEPAYQALSAEIELKARTMPGFIDFKSFVAADGEQVSVATFATPADQRAWRDDLAHRRPSNRAGRSSWTNTRSRWLDAATPPGGHDHRGDVDRSRRHGLVEPGRVGGDRWPGIAPDDRVPLGPAVAGCRLDEAGQRR